MTGIGCTMQNVTSSIWVVTAVRRSTSEMVVDGRLVQCTFYLVGVDVPDRFFGSLLIATARTVEMIARQKNTRRVPRISFDRLYIAHTRRIITTAIVIRVTFSESDTTTHNRPHQQREQMPIQ